MLQVEVEAGGDLESLAEKRFCAELLVDELALWLDEDDDEPGAGGVALDVVGGNVAVTPGLFPATPFSDVGSIA